MQQYIQAIMQGARYEADSDGSTYGVVTVLTPIEAQGRTHTQCAAALRIKVQQAVVEALEQGQALPVFNAVHPPTLSV